MAVSIGSEVEDALGALRVDFAQFRKTAGDVRRHRYPIHLKQRVALFLDEGISRPELASACGVAFDTVESWRGFAPPKPLPPPRRLAVIPSEKIKEAAYVAAKNDTSAGGLVPRDVFRFSLAHGVVCEASAQQALWLVRALQGGQ